MIFLFFFFFFFFFFLTRLPWRTPEDDIFRRGWRICAEPNCKEVILANDIIHSFRTHFVREGSCLLYLNVTVMIRLLTRSIVHDRG